MVVSEKQDVMADQLKRHNELLRVLKRSDGIDLAEKYVSKEMTFLNAHRRRVFKRVVNSLVLVSVVLFAFSMAIENQVLKDYGFNISAGLLSSVLLVAILELFWHQRETILAKGLDHAQKQVDILGEIRQVTNQISEELRIAHETAFTDEEWTVWEDTFTEKSVRRLKGLAEELQSSIEQGRKVHDELKKKPD